MIFVKQYYSSVYLVKALKMNTSSQIARINNVGVKTIYRAKERLHLTKKKNLWRPKELDALRMNYPTNPKICELLKDRTTYSINHKAHKLGLHRIQKSGKYTVDDKFFDIWSPESAYTFGFLCSDGNVGIKGTYFGLHIHKKDKQIVNLIRNAMKSNQRIREYGNYIDFKIYNKRLTRRLIGLGCTPRKSLTLKFPTVPDSYINHFVRGYYDGDGSIFFNKPNTIKIKLVGTKPFFPFPYLNRF